MTAISLFSLPRRYDEQRVVPMSAKRGLCPFAEQDLGMSRFARAGKSPALIWWSILYRLCSKTTVPAEPRGLEPRWPYNRQRKRMVDRQSSNKQLRKPQKTNPRLDPDTKRPLSDRDRGGWLLPALIIGIMVAGIAIFAFGNHMPTATNPAPDTATGQSSRAPGSTPEGPPPVNR
jgi:hypothetical protein